MFQKTLVSVLRVKKPQEERLAMQTGSWKMACWSLNPSVSYLVGWLDEKRGETENMKLQDKIQGDDSEIGVSEVFYVLSGPYCGTAAVQTAGAA